MRSLILECGSVVSSFALFIYKDTKKIGIGMPFIVKNRRICNYLKINRLFGLLENWVTK